MFVAETDLPENGIISLIAARDGDDIDGRVYTVTVTVYDAGRSVRQQQRGRCRPSRPGGEREVTTG